jgi:crotonobetainyl-CoA:carnitine CoA-transferase CaiB-like acyl-CoA transferase
MFSIDTRRMKSDASTWERELSAAGVPAARILTVAQAVRSEQLAHRRFFHDVPFPGDPERVVRTSGNGVHIDGRPLHPQGPPPVLGEHNDELEVLRRAGRSRAGVGGAA